MANTHAEVIGIGRVVKVSQNSYDRQDGSKGKITSVVVAVERPYDRAATQDDLQNRSRDIFERTIDGARHKRITDTDFLVLKIMNGMGDTLMAYHEKAKAAGKDGRTAIHRIYFTGNPESRTWNKEVEGKQLANVNIEGKTYQIEVPFKTAVKVTSTEIALDKVRFLDYFADAPTGEVSVQGTAGPVEAAIVTGTPVGESVPAASAPIAATAAAPAGVGVSGTDDDVPF